MNKVPITPEGKSLVESEVKNRKAIERPRIINSIAEARAHGDLSENAEYHAAKEEQSHNETKIMELEDTTTTFVKEEPSFLKLDNSLSEVEWKDGLFPIEVHLVGEITADSVSELETKIREAQRSGQKEIPLVIDTISFCVAGVDCL